MTLRRHSRQSNDKHADAMTIASHARTAVKSFTMSCIRTSLTLIVGMVIGSLLFLNVELPKTSTLMEARKTTTVGKSHHQFLQDSRKPVSQAKFPEYHGPSRVYQEWNHSKSVFPCVPRRAAPTVGNLFIGSPKVASTTTGGIMLRISRNLYKRTHDNKINDAECKVHEIHYSYPAWMNRFGTRNKTTSFLWSFLREPTSRFTSEFFHFQVSRQGIQPTDANFQRYLTTGSNLNNLYIYNLHPRGGNHMQNATKAVEQILNEYNFIGITERMHESLVVLKLLLGLELNDILYVQSTKTSGGFDDGVYNDTCVYIVKSFVSLGMQDFFATNGKWKEYTRGDLMLYQAANKSLDLTIAALGKDLVKRELQEYERAMQVAQETCQNVKLPCSADGLRQKKHDCLYWDLACGYECLENLDMGTAAKVTN